MNDRTILALPSGYAIVENGRLVEYLEASDNSQSGDILIARVDRIMKGLDCAFVDIGRKKDGFLPLSEKSLSFDAPPLRSGDLITVQIRREETGEKGALLSRDISIPGKYVILMPMNRYIGISARIDDPKERERLMEIGRKTDARDYGIIFRNSSADAAEKEIRYELTELIRIWQNVRVHAGKIREPGAVVFLSDPASQLMNDYPDTEIRKVSGLTPDLLRQLKCAEQRTVPLRNGGNIVIDICEALTVVDVNSGAAHEGGEKERTVTETNLEACDEAAVQIRLRNITGIILIDFIDMENEDDRMRVMSRLREQFSCDRRKTVIHGWTSLGIMEMTRKRV